MERQYLFVYTLTSPLPVLSAVFYKHEGAEPWRMKPAEIGLRIAFADSRVIIIGSREDITAEKIVLALEKLDPDIR